MNLVHSLRAKLVGAMVLILTLTFTLHLANNARLTRNLLTIASDTRLAELSPLLGAALAPSVFERDLATLSEELRDIAKIDSVLSIDVRDSRNTLLSRTEPLVPVGAATDERQTINLTTPITLSGEQIGTASVVLSAALLESASQAVVAKGLLLAMATAAVSVLTLLLLSTLITRRLATLESTANAVAAGDFTVRAPSLGRDEVGRVARTFNSMLDRLHDANRALEKEHQQLETLIESLPHGAYLKDREGRYTLVNRAFAGFVGRSSPELVGRSTSVFFSDKETEEAQSIDREVVGTGKPVHRSFVSTPPDDEPHHLEITKFPVFGRDGKIIGVGGINVDVSERYHFKQKLADTEKRFRILIDNLPYSLAMKDPAGRYTLVNSAFCKTFRVTDPPEGVIGKTASDMFPAGAARRSRAADRHVMNKQRSLRYRSWFTLDDGSNRVLDVTKFPVFDHAGQMIGLASVAIDITEQEEAEKARLDSEHRFQVIADSLPHPLFMKDTVGRYLFVNAAGQALFEPDSGDYAGKTAADMLAPEVAARTGAIDQAVLENERPAREVILYERAGKTRFHDVIKFPIFDTGGALIGLAGIAVDVTEQRRADEARQQSEQRLRALIENLPFAISMNDLDGRYVIASPLLAKNLDRPIEDIYGKRIQDLLPDKIAREYRRIETEVRATRHPVTREVISKCPNGEDRILEVTKFPVFDTDRDLVGMAGFNLDITERRHTDNRIAHAQRMEMIGQLAGGVAHDFNNLLAVIRGNLEILGEQTRETPELTRRVQAGLRAVRRGATLTERLLAVGRRQSLRADAIRPNQILGEIIDVIRSALGSKTRVTLNSPLGLWPVWVDAGRLEDALLNIALNAGAAMPDGGRLDIRAQNLEIETVQPGSDLNPGRYVVLSLRDSGLGIPAEIRPRIMEPFFSTKRNGSGLGLSVVYGFMRQSGGGLTIESEEGKGTTVQLVLPCGPPGKQKRPPATAPHKREPRHNIAIVVDDQPDMLALTARRLQELGYETRQATDASTALSALSEHPYAAVLVTDVVFGNGMEGIELARTARNQIPTLPILLVSGQAIRRDIGAGDPSTAFLSKPFSKEQLADTLALLSV